jgi:tRNA nucleotidyltransferase (CCA-adding enzyme)
MPRARKSLLSQPAEDPALRARCEALFREVAARVSPTREESDRERAFAQGLIRRLEKALKGQATVNFIGSAARDTGLRGDRDIDLFVCWPREREREDIVKRTLDAARRTIPAAWVQHYAEHPYLQARLGEYKVEVIPCFRLQPHEKLKSAVDRSVLHMAYLQDRLTPEQRRDVRVLKAFLRNAGIYGAELEVEGFSGLVCEHLLLNYRSLYGLLRAAANEWRLPVLVDLEQAYPAQQAREELYKRFPAPIILIDAVDRNRNAAAAISTENAARFIALCRAFLAKPSPEFFARKVRHYTPREILRALRERETYLAVLRFPRPKEMVSDILFPMLKRAGASLRRHLTLADFWLVGSATFCTDSECFLLVELEEAQAHAVKRVTGPPVNQKPSVERFLQAHLKGVLRGPYLEGDRVYYELKRAQRDARAHLQRLAKSPDIGVSKEMAALLRKAKLVEGPAVAKLPAGALQPVGEYLFRREWFW